MSDKINKPVIPFYRATQTVLFIIFKGFFRLKVYNAGNVPKDSRGVILAPNHVSYFDPPVLGISLARHITYLAKDYLFRVWWLGPILRWLGVLPIKTQSDDFRSVRQLLRVLKEGRCIVVFPEGTRSPDGNFQKAEVGVGFLAAKSEAYVVPVYIDGTFQAFPKGGKVKFCPVSVHFGNKFIPAHDKALMASPDPYLAISEKIMADIKELKEKSVR